MSGCGITIKARDSTGAAPPQVPVHVVQQPSGPLQQPTGHFVTGCCCHNTMETVNNHQFTMVTIITLVALT